VYRSVVALGAAAPAFLLVGAFADQNATTVAGLALAAATVTRWIDVAVQQSDSRRKDLNETRRVLYMARLAGQTPHAELVGTIVNALAHHGSEIDAREASVMVADAINGGAAGRVWVDQQIAQITAKLDKLSR
jgi:hypothetical protein